MFDIRGDANGVLWIRNDGKPFAKVTDERELDKSELESRWNDELFSKKDLDFECSQSYNNGWDEGKEEGESEGFERAKSDILDIIADEQDTCCDCEKITNFLDKLEEKIKRLD